MTATLAIAGCVFVLVWEMRETAVWVKARLVAIRPTAVWFFVTTPLTTILAVAV